jgi:prophage DNA circulation protein
MSTLQQVAGAVAGLSSSTQGIVNGLDGLAAYVNGGTTDFWSQLRPASYRNVPFVVTSGGGQMGRRNAVHEYPFRDTPWVEDLGKSARRFQVVGFLIGDDVIAQRDAMIAAVEQPGDGELIHPTYGRLQVSLIGFDTAESEWGRTFEIRFTFVRQGQRMFPSAASVGTAQLFDAAQTLSSAGAAAFVTRAIAHLSNGAAAINEAAQQATAWATKATAVAQDATSLLKLSVTLPGQFGRLLGLASGVDVGQQLIPTAGLTTADLTATAAVSRAAVATACAALVAAATRLGVSTTQPFTDAAQGVASAILTVASTPGDALRGLATLANFQPVGAAAGDEFVIQQACADAFRRAALSSMAVAGSNYQPATSDDAASARNQVLDILDVEITIAGDQFEDDVFSALKALRAQVVQDLNTRGAQLPTLVTVNFAIELPSLVLAQRLYRDPTRADGLVTRAVPIHPAFMPRSFEALNS